ncbi:hypothetical protein JOF36_005891 [Pseudonocardia parietis]|uniref:Uncharacterized protein n=1 Tax=Pseudonocardia parietis TaxID=570936 RepID=A0ABS4W204_9PSEU|nr:hypothetical protein [Pseudonocardia parietis]
MQVERDISLVANLAPAAWHTVLDDTEWRVLLAATDWAGALQALAWLAGVDEPGWAVSDLVADQWASTLHAEQWAAVAAVAEWAVSTPWITTPGEAGPGMRLNSKEFVKVTVTPSKDPATGTPLDISADLVEMCVTLATHPEELDWQPAAWVGTADVTTGAIACRLLVQPSALGLAANSQPAVFVRVHDNPEIPVLKAGQLSIN